MTIKSVQPHLNYILDTLKIIERNTPSSREEFLNDVNAQDATLMRLQDIGEQLAHIRDRFPEFFEQNHEDSWFRLIGLRNVISHGYHEIDFEIIWEILNTKLPEYAERIRKLAETDG